MPDFNVADRFLAGLDRIEKVFERESHADCSSFSTLIGSARSTILLADSRRFLGNQFQSSAIHEERAVSAVKT
jgi:hypothetical protein